MLEVSRRNQRFLAVSLFILLAALLLSLISAKPARAAGETGTWVDGNTIHYNPDNTDYVKKSVNSHESFIKSGDVNDLCAATDHQASRSTKYAQAYSQGRTISMIRDISGNSANHIVYHIYIYNQYGQVKKPSEVHDQSGQLVLNDGTGVAYYGCDHSDKDQIQITLDNSKANSDYFWSNSQLIGTTSGRAYASDGQGHYNWTADPNPCKEHIDPNGSPDSHPTTGKLYFGGSRDGSGNCKWSVKPIDIARPENSTGAAGTGPATTTQGTPGADDPCKKIDGFAYILCPMIRAVGDLIKNQFDCSQGNAGFICHELQTPPLDADGKTEQVWQGFRDITNVLLALIFIFVIFAQTLSIGLDAYTIKKVLPRLVAAAVLVQFSWLVCSLVVDVTNILGAGIPNLVLRTLPGGGAGYSNFVGIISGIGASIAGVAVIAALGAWLLILPLVISLLIAVLSFLFTLALRHFLIRFLIILSPLGICAMVLPGTERYFKFWWQNFLKLMLMYPMIILIIQMSVIVRSTDDSILGLIAPIVAFLMVPATFKASGMLMGAVSGAIASRAGRLSGAATSKVKSSEGYKAAQARRKDRMLAIKTGSFGKDVGGVRGRAMRGFGTVVGTTAKVGSLGLYGRNKVANQRQLQDTAKNFKDQFQALNLNPDQLGAISKGEAGIAELEAMGRGDLVKYSRDTGARLAALQSKGEQLGLSPDDLAIIGGMANTDLQRNQYLATAMAGGSFSKTLEKNPDAAFMDFNTNTAAPTLKRSFDATTGTMDNGQKTAEVLSKRLTAENISNLGDGQIERLTPFISPTAAQRALEPRTRSRLSDAAITKLEGIAAAAPPPPPGAPPGAPPPPAPPAGP